MFEQIFSGAVGIDNKVQKCSQKSGAQANISSNPEFLFFTCPANRPRAAVQCVSEEQPGYSGRQSAANLRPKSFHPPSPLAQKNNQKVKQLTLLGSSFYRNK